MNEFLTCDMVEFDGSGEETGRGVVGVQPSRITPNSPEIPAKLKPRVELWPSPAENVERG